MTFKIKIEFGGLCLLVREEDPAKQLGLHVLMPTMQMMMPGMYHCPMVMFHRENTAGSVDCMRSFGGYALDLRSGIAPSPLVPLPSQLLAISSYAKQRVDDKWLTDAPAGCLMARLTMPVDTRLKVLGNPGDLKIPGEPRVRAFYGRVQADFDHADPPAAIQIAGRDVTPGANGIMLRMVNIPMETLDGKRRASKFGERADHVQAYYHLLKGCCNPPVDGPDIFKGEEWAADNGAGGPIYSCPVPLKDFPYYPWTIGDNGHYIDPLNCTVGIGCPESAGKC